MATTPHSTLTGADLHEPKGVATATSGQIYIANGSGSGAWTSKGLWTIVHKTSDTARTSTTTLAADPTLTFAVATNSKYLLRGVLFVHSNATPDFKMQFVGPASSTFRGEVIYRPAGVTTLSGDEIDESSDLITIANGNSNEVGVIYEMYYTTAGTSGNFEIHWAQNTSSASATTMQAGSYLEYIKIA